MTDKPKIEVGQRWVTRDGDMVRVLATDGRYPNAPVIVESEDGSLDCVRADGRCFETVSSVNDLISLAPQTIKREVALYRYGDLREIFDTDDSRMLDTDDDWQRMTEPLTIEFTLLPGEST